MTVLSNASKPRFLEQIVWLLHTPQKYIEVVWADVKHLIGSNNCELFATANALALCAGFIPEECNCEQESLSTWLSVLASYQKNAIGSKSHWVLGTLCWLHTRRMQLRARVTESAFFSFFNAWLVARYHYPQCVGRKEDTWHLRTDLTIRAEVFCHCCQPHKRRRFMVECSGCVGWYYRTCDAVPKQVQKNVHFFCSSCSDHWKGMKFFFFSFHRNFVENKFIHSCCLEPSRPM